MKRRGWGGRRGLGLAAGVAAALLVFELVARQIFWLPYIQDPRLSAILPAGTVARFCREGCARTTWVADGVRSSAPPDASSVTLLVLGDSYTEALMIDDASVFSRGIEKALAETAPPVQVLNMGRSGASTADYVALAGYYREHVDPSWTLVQLRQAGLEGNAFQEGGTHFRITDAGGVEVVEVPPRVSRWNRELSRVRRESALASLATTRLKEFARAAAAEPPLFRGGHAPAATSPAPVAYPVAAELEAVADAFGGRITFFFIPAFDPLDPVTPGATERVFDATCAARGWSCVNLRATFPAFAARHEAPAGFPNTRFNWGHMNEAGHVAAGELLGAELRRLRALAVF